MATVELTQRQKKLLESLNLPTTLTTDMDEDEWFEITDTLGDEIQMHGITAAWDGTNDHGETCRQTLDAMAEAEE